ncbi:DEAD/DEAH box helicase [Anoxybacteroides tepidamans]|uniref:DEAD/DEAH box helicase n=1 Tax=Anoxybacteroides tepidamans TaxID=265948 RepID=UPI000485C270|nr:DEAD/DEAH box helicase [Anoxybacillus tepidamans]
MILDDNQKNTVEQLLKVDLHNIASQLGFIKKDPVTLEQKLLYSAIGLIDEFSREKAEEYHKIATTLSALLWYYRQSNWEGLKDFLVLVLSRMGLPPSAIMIDKGYDKVNYKHSSLNSLINEISVALNQLRNEVKIKEKKYLLTDFQKEIWNQIDAKRVTGISAPTSAGKSFVILLKSMQLLLEKDGTIVYVVPNLSLVSQVASDYKKELTNFGLNAYQVLTSYDGNCVDKRKIFVLTQERAIAAFSQKENPFPELRLLVIDEIQNVEQMSSEDELRSKILYDSLIEFRYNTKADKIIIAGPRIEKIDKLAKDIFDDIAHKGETNHSPVVNITYSVDKKGNYYIFKQYTDLLDYPLEIKIANDKHIAGFGQSRYTEEYHQYLRYILKSLGEDSINIIFSPTSKQARKTAAEISGGLKDTNNEKLQSLISYIKETVHDKYSLCDFLVKQVAYHHGKLPHHVRKVIEKAVSERLIKNIVCTTTLMQGVNLPAQNVIIRNPNLFIRRKSGKTPKKLTSYELANLRGRAGRLLKDFIGRTFILDESAFEVEEQQISLFEDSTKELKATYQDKFLDYKGEIIYALINGDTAESETPYSFLLPYIRQTILRFGNQARKRLSAVGIDITDSLLNNISRSMRELKVPINVCISNRYWDPLHLNEMYNITVDEQIH